MYVTIKLDGNVGTIHCINVDGKEIMPDLRYNIAPHKFVHRGSEGFGLREAVDETLNQKKEKKNPKYLRIKTEEREREKKSKSVKNIMKNT